MRALFLLASVMLLVATGCESTLPEKVALVPGASNVEVVSDPPNPELYEGAGEVSATVIAHEIGDGLRQAANELRNQAAKKGATFVSMDDVSSHATWDFSGRVVVTISGTAYKVK
jgi:hypothetical protein